MDLGKAGDYDVSGSDGKFGVNLGAGMEFDLDKNWSLNFDIKYQLISEPRPSRIQSWRSL